MYELSNANSLLDKYEGGDREDEELKVLPVRVEKSLIQNLDRVAESNPMIESRSVIVRAFLNLLVEELPESGVLDER